MATGKIVLGGFQIDRQMLEAADRLARETDRSRSAIIRIALREFIEKREKANAQHESAD